MMFYNNTYFYDFESVHQFCRGTNKVRVSLIENTARPDLVTDAGRIINGDLTAPLAPAHYNNITLAGGVLRFSHRQKFRHSARKFRHLPRKFRHSPGLNARVPVAPVCVPPALVLRKDN